MSRLDGIAARLGVTRTEAKQYTRKIRDHFDKAPSYAVILDVLRHSSMPRPSPIQLVAAIKKKNQARSAARATRNKKPAARPTGSVRGKRAGPTGVPPQARSKRKASKRKRG